MHDDSNRQVDAGNTGFGLRDFVSSYRWLARGSIMVDKRRSVTIAALEFASSASNLGAVLLLIHGLKLLDRQGVGDSGLLAFLGHNVDPKIAMLVLVGVASAAALYLGAFLSMEAAKLARQVAREYQIRLMRRLIRDFANAPPGRLDLSVSQRKLFAPNFTFGPQICGVAVETILRLLRPLSLITIFAAAIIYLAWWLLVAVLAITLLALPFLYGLYRTTAHHSSRVYGEERREVLQDIVALVRRIDQSPQSGPDLAAEAIRSLDENQDLPRVLDSYDFWKLSSDRGQYLATAGRAVATQFLILALVALVLTGTSVTWPSIIGLLLVGMRLQDAVYSALVRALALSRFFPVVTRMRAFQPILEEAAAHLDEHREAHSANGGTGRRILLISKIPLLKSTFGHHLEALREAKLLTVTGKESIPRIRVIQEISAPASPLGELLDRSCDERNGAKQDRETILRQVLSPDAAILDVIDINTRCNQIWERLGEPARIFFMLLDALREANLVMIALPGGAADTVGQVLARWLAHAKADIVVLLPSEPEDTGAYDQVIRGDRSVVDQTVPMRPDEGILAQDELEAM